MSSQRSVLLRDNVGGLGQYDGMPRDHFVPAVLLGQLGSPAHKGARLRRVAAWAPGAPPRFLRVETLGWRENLYPADFESRLARIETVFGTECVPEILAYRVPARRSIARGLAPFVASLIARRPEVAAVRRDQLLAEWSERLGRASWAFRRSSVPLILGDTAYVLKESRVHVAVDEVLVTADWTARARPQFGLLGQARAVRYNEAIAAASVEFIAARGIHTVAKWAARTNLPAASAHIDADTRAKGAACLRAI